jgi:hypothetical protein
MVFTRNEGRLRQMEAYLHDVIGTLLGFVVGVLWAEWKSRRERAAQAKLLRANLVKACKFALDGIDKCLEYLLREQPVIPNFRLDSASVGHILFTGRDLFPDAKFFDQFNWQRYQLDHINAKLDYFHFYMAASGERATSLMIAEGQSLVAHLKTTRKELGELVDSFENETNGM